MSDAVEAQVRMECLRLAKEIVRESMRDVVSSDQTLDRIMVMARRLYDFVTADQTEEMVG